jgi:hypothetical protein
MFQNNPLVLVGFYQNLYHHSSKAEFKISSVMRMKNLQDTGIDNVLFLEKSCTVENIHDLFRGATSTEEK